MPIDPSAVAGLVDREVRTGERDGAVARAVIARRTYTTDRSDLWDAMTNPERIPRWFLPISGTLEVGGRYQLEGNASGTIEACKEPESFAVTWEYDGSTSWLTITLVPAVNGTTLEVAYESPVDPQFWGEYGPGATGLGWDLSMMALDQYLDTGEGFGAADQAEFSASSAGAAFLRASAAGWADAAIADGDAVESAREAAQRSLAFYSPPSDETSPT